MTDNNYKHPGNALQVSQPLQLFIVTKNDGIRQEYEDLVVCTPSTVGVGVVPDSTSRNYIHYAPSSYSVRKNDAFPGSLAMSATGYKIIINRARRMRSEYAPSSTSCPP